ncbi:unnamed protein product [Gordionus sp. m RMFG-2023]|uniref:probable cyclin-dependent serine/threonine-protein kinase DDB_G0292550 isoform X2 n=1 Tax=Gordionus sp. m RMFG-2023 TaxID=3053472 RepID=UPI0030E3067E
MQPSSLISQDDECSPVHNDCKNLENTIIQNGQNFPINYSLCNGHTQNNDEESNYKQYNPDCNKDIKSCIAAITHNYILLPGQDSHQLPLFNLSDFIANKIEKSLLQNNHTNEQVTYNDSKKLALENNFESCNLKNLNNTESHTIKNRTRIEEINVMNSKIVEVLPIKRQLLNNTNINNTKLPIAKPPTKVIAKTIFPSISKNIGDVIEHQILKTESLGSNVISSHLEHKENQIYKTSSLNLHCSEKLDESIILSKDNETTKNLLKYQNLFSPISYQNECKISNNDSFINHTNDATSQLLSPQSNTIHNNMNNSISNNFTTVPINNYTNNKFNVLSFTRKNLMTSTPMLQPISQLQNELSQSYMGANYVNNGARIPSPGIIGLNAKEFQQLILLNSHHQFQRHQPVPPTHFINNIINNNINNNNSTSSNIHKNNLINFVNLNPIQTNTISPNYCPLSQFSSFFPYNNVPVSNKCQIAKNKTIKTTAQLKNFNSAFLMPAGNININSTNRNISMWNTPSNTQNGPVMIGASSTILQPNFISNKAQSHIESSLTNGNNCSVKSDANHPYFDSSKFSFISESSVHSLNNSSGQNLHFTPLDKLNPIPLIKPVSQTSTLSCMHSSHKALSFHNNQMGNNPTNFAFSPLAPRLLPFVPNSQGYSTASQNYSTLPHLNYSHGNNLNLTSHLILSPLGRKKQPRKQNLNLAALNKRSGSVVEIHDSEESPLIFDSNKNCFDTLYIDDNTDHIGKKSLARNNSQHSGKYNPSAFPKIDDSRYKRFKSSYGAVNSSFNEITMSADSKVIKMTGKKYRKNLLSMTSSESIDSFNLKRAKAGLKCSVHENMDNFMMGKGMSAPPLDYKRPKATKKIKSELFKIEPTSPGIKASTPVGKERVKTIKNSYYNRVVKPRLLGVNGKEKDMSNESPINQKKKKRGELIYHEGKPPPPLAKEEKPLPIPGIMDSCSYYDNYRSANFNSIPFSHYNKKDDVRCKESINVNLGANSIGTNDIANSLNGPVNVSDMSALDKALVNYLATTNNTSSASIEKNEKETCKDDPINSPYPNFSWKILYLVSQLDKILTASINHLNFLRTYKEDLYSQKISLKVSSSYNISKPRSNCTHKNSSPLTLKVFEGTKKCNNVLSANQRLDFEYFQFYMDNPFDPDIRFYEKLLANLQRSQYFVNELLESKKYLIHSLITSHETLVRDGVSNLYHFTNNFNNLNGITKNISSPTTNLPSPNHFSSLIKKWKR